MRLLEGALEVSEYTDRIDILCANRARRIVMEIRQVCSILTGLVVSHDYGALICITIIPPTFPAAAAANSVAAGDIFQAQ